MYPLSLVELLRRLVDRALVDSSPSERLDDLSFFKEPSVELALRSGGGRRGIDEVVRVERWRMERGRWGHNSSGL